MSEGWGTEQAGEGVTLAEEAGAGAESGTDTS